MVHPLGVGIGSFGVVVDYRRLAICGLARIPRSRAGGSGRSPLAVALAHLRYIVVLTWRVDGYPKIMV